MTTSRKIGCLSVVSLLLGAGVLLTAPTPAGAEPYLALRTGYKCSQCHVNRTGGGKRTGFGVVYSQIRLPLLVAKLDGGSGLFARELNEQISLGGNLRTANTTTFRGGKDDNALTLTEANLYVEAEVVKGLLSFYFDETLGPGGASNREAFGLIQGLPLDGYVKAGRLLLPFGFRLLDDQAFIRQRTGFNYTTSDLGVEVGLEPGPLSFAAALSNGTQGGPENNAAKQFSLVGSTVFRSFRVGGSFSQNKSPAGTRRVFGAFGGFNLGRFTFLGEADRIEDDAGGQETWQNLFFLEGDLLLTRGVNLKATYEFLDPNTRIGENARTRVRVGLEPFLTQFLQLGVFYVFNQDIPRSRSDQDQLTIELHTFF